jgi:hypothetical protein
MCRNPLPWALLVVVCTLGVAACTSGDAGQESEAAEAGEEEAELALYMARLQRWTHKTALALQERNPELAEFYLHEMEESVETIRTEAPTYEGHAIADLTGELLVPSLEALDGALEERAWAAVDARLADLAQSCNQCHTATEHGVVRVDLDDVPNPYAQDFSPGSE